MKIPAKKIIIAIFLGALIFNAGFSFAKTNEIVYPNKNFIYLSEDEASEERRREFWEKFRETVKPREKNPPPAAEKPREVRPREVYPREVQPQEAE